MISQGCTLCIKSGSMVLCMGPARGGAGPILLVQDGLFWTRRRAGVGFRRVVPESHVQEGQKKFVPAVKQCRGVLLVWMIVGQGPIALAVCAGGGCLDIFSLIYIFPFLSPSLWETARYRLKYCLKGPLNPKQPTNNPAVKNTAGALGRGADRFIYARRVLLEFHAPSNSGPESPGHREGEAVVKPNTAGGSVGRARCRHRK